MPGWVSSSELLILLIVLGLAVAELISTRRIIARDRRKAREEGRET